VQKLEGSPRLLVYSDGVFEIEKPDGSMWQAEEYIQYVSGLTPQEGSLLDTILTHVRQLHGKDTLADDFSLVEISF
jgi:sigma-B regulation protein RsbU (phosphoserine phosphatase)